jgi:cytochrome b561
MKYTTIRTRYSPVAQTLHWLTVLLVGAAYLASEGGPETRVYSADRVWSLSLHETFGALVLLVLLLRLALRLFDRPPEEPAMPAWMAVSSKVVHWLLYALLAAVPLTAILGAWYEGHPVMVFGIGAIGPFVAASHDLGRSITGIHPLLGDAIIWIAGVHAAAALVHHFFLRDRVLLSMLPGRRVS